MSCIAPRLSSLSLSLGLRLRLRSGVARRLVHVGEEIGPQSVEPPAVIPPDYSRPYCEPQDRLQRDQSAGRLRYEWA